MKGSKLYIDDEFIVTEVESICKLYKRVVICDCLIDRKKMHAKKDRHFRHDQIKIAL